MSKTFKKVSPIKYREVLETVEKFVIANNEKEDNEVMNTLYKMIHPFAGRCNNPHWDWREEQEKMEKELKYF